MQEVVLIQDMAIVMVASAVTMVICHHLRLPIVLGYILAGLLIGPHTPPYSLIKDIHSIHTLSTLGVIFLLFSIGMEFSLRKLAKVGIVAFLASTFEIILMLGIGYYIGQWMGWKQMDSLFLGALLSISSTTIIAKIFMENKLLNERFAQVVLGILVVEDLWAILMIAVLSSVAMTGDVSLDKVWISLIKVMFFMGGILYLGFLFVPRIFNYISRFKMPEVMIVVVLGLCLGGSLLAAKWGLSIALGAFLMGAIIAETRQSEDIITRMQPIRDMFTAIFFVAVGMMIEPDVLVKYALPIVLFTIVTILGKMASCSLVAFLTGYDSRTSLKVGLALAQIGEFSFIIAQLGQDTGVTSSFLYPVAVSVSAITTISTPFLMRNSDAIIAGMKGIVPKPFLTFAHFYPTWISKLGQKEITSRRKMFILGHIRSHLPRLIFYIVSIVAVYYLANRYDAQVDLPAFVYWGITILIITPFFIGLVNALDRIFWEDVFLNLIRAEIDEAKETGEFFHNVIRFLLVFLASLATFLPAASHIFPAGRLIILVVILSFSCAVLIWRSVRRIHENIEKTVMSVFDFEKPGNEEHIKSTHDKIVDLIRTDYPLAFETQDYMLPFDECAVNRTIRELDLRSKTGASIVGIYRSEEAMPNPSAETKLLPGDVLVLIGNKEQLKNAIHYLQELIKHGC